MNEEELILDPVFMSRQTGAVLQNPLMGAVFALIRFKINHGRVYCSQMMISCFDWLLEK